MHYSSGKTRIAKRISEVIIGREEREREFFSLFCGACSIETRLASHFSKITLNDKQYYLMSLWQSVQNGWRPPDELSVEEYYYVKENKDENPALTGFVGFGCSFGGKWFGGYGRHGNKDKHAFERSMCQESKRGLLRDAEILKNATFLNLDYKDVVIPDGSVIYCDPPYASKMAAFGSKEKFNSEEFWDYMRELSKKNHVYISELSAPDDFEMIWEKPVLRQMANCNAENFVSTEKLFIY